MLLVEDSADDALLVALTLEQGGYEPYCERVETPEAMRETLEEAPWDAVIADHAMPRFSAPAALRVLQEKGMDLPFIIVSGEIGEDAAVAVMMAGAHDYITKGNLRRLCPAIERELKEAEERRERRRSDAVLRASEELYRSVVEQSSECIFLVDARTSYVIEANGAFKELLGYDHAPEELLEMTLYDFVVQDRESVDRDLWLLAENGRLAAGWRYLRKDGSTVEAEVRANVFSLDGRETLCCISGDATGRDTVGQAPAGENRRTSSGGASGARRPTRWRSLLPRAARWFANRSFLPPR